jgi:predicted nucleic acid-binding protein
MNYLLDSNTVSDAYDKWSQDHPKIYQKLRSLSDSDCVYVSLLTLYELEYGWANAPDEKKEVIRKKIDEVQQDFAILPLSLQGARVFGELKQSIQVSRSPSKENMKKYNVDLMVAATAITANCILVSADMLYAELQKLNQRLHVVNWTV